MSGYVVLYDTAKGETKEKRIKSFEGARRAMLTNINDAIAHADLALIPALVEVRTAAEQVSREVFADAGAIVFDNEFDRRLGVIAFSLERG